MVMKKAKKVMNRGKKAVKKGTKAAKRVVKKGTKAAKKAASKGKKAVKKALRTETAKEIVRREKLLAADILMKAVNKLRKEAKKK